MFWDLPLDDFSGSFCGQGPYPLIGAVAKALGGYVPKPPPTHGPQTQGPKTHAPRTHGPHTQGPHKKGCHAIGPWKGDKRMDQWCIDNCRLGNCPASTCKCDA